MTKAGLAIACVLAVGSAGAAFGQGGAPTGGGPMPGGGDLRGISSGTQQQNADYNSLVGAGTKVTNGEVENPRRRQRSAVPATLADITPGSQLRDSLGKPIATVVSVAGEEAMVDTGAMKINVPVAAFGKDDDGLLLGITAAQFNELVNATTAN